MYDRNPGEIDFGSNCRESTALGFLVIVKQHIIDCLSQFSEVLSFLPNGKVRVTCLVGQGDRIVPWTRTRFLKSDDIYVANQGRLCYNNKTALTRLRLRFP